MVTGRHQRLVVLALGLETQKMSWLARCYAGRHWRGELSLGVSYWLNGFFGNILASTLVSAIISAMGEEYNPIESFIAIIIAWSIVFGVAIWQIVGVWRSANQPVSYTHLTLPTN